MNENKTNINWYPGHMAKAKREIKEKLDLIDIVYEVIDSRMPKSSRIVDLDELIKDKYIKEYEENNIVIKTNLKENSIINKEIISKTELLLENINKKVGEKYE